MSTANTNISALSSANIDPYSRLYCVSLSSTVNTHTNQISVLQTSDTYKNLFLTSLSGSNYGFYYSQGSQIASANSNISTLQGYVTALQQVTTNQSNSSGVTTFNDLAINGMYVNNTILMNDHPLYLRGSGDFNHYIKYNGTRDGPQLVGSSGGQLFTGVNSTEQLGWNIYGIHIANTLKLNSTTESTSSISGAVIISGGVGIAKNLNVNGSSNITGNLKVTGTVSMTNTTDSTTSTNGAVVIAGGVGIAKSLNVSSDLAVSGSSYLTYVNADWIAYNHCTSGTANGFMKFIGGGRITGTVNTLSTVSTQISFNTGLASAYTPFIMVSLDDGASNNTYIGYLTVWANRTSWNGSTWTSYINVYNNFDSNYYNGYPHNTTTYGVTYMAYQF
jgi:hypothetical protein